MQAQQMDAARSVMHNDTALPSSVQAVNAHRNAMDMLGLMSGSFHPSFNGNTMMYGHSMGDGAHSPRAIQSSPSPIRNKQQHHHHNDSFSSAGTAMSRDSSQSYDLLNNTVGDGEFAFGSDNSFVRYTSPAEGMYSDFGNHSSSSSGPGFTGDFFNNDNTPTRKNLAQGLSNFSMENY
jgi:hypothetical protein